MCDKLLNRNRKKVKYKEIRSLPKIQQCTFCPYEQKQYWKETLAKFEKFHRKKNYLNVKSYKFSTTIPSELYERVSKFIEITPIEEEFFEDLENDENDSSEGVSKEDEKSDIESSSMTECVEDAEAKDLKTLKESMISNDTIFGKFLKEIEKEQDKGSAKEFNWFKNYVCTERKERIQWNTKLYDLQKDKKGRQLIEYAEDVMDEAAERLTEFINKLGTDETTDITKEMVKDLFKIEIKEDRSTNKQEGKRLSVDIGDDPRKLSKLIATNPEFIEFQKMKRYSRKVNKKQPKIAFGRTIPKQNAGCLPLKVEKSYEPYFPEELRTGEVIFSGISNLKVIKNLIKYYLEHDELKRPEYLVKNGYFNQIDGDGDSGTGTVPFCELVKK